MLVHQFILVFVSAFKRFESHLLHLPGEIRRRMSGGEVAEADLQEVESEQAA